MMLKELGDSQAELDLVIAPMTLDKSMAAVSHYTVPIRDILLTSTNKGIAADGIVRDPSHRQTCIKVGNGD